MDKYVAELLVTLRDIGFSWIAEEIEETIHSGKSIEKEISEIQGRRTKKASMIVPLTQEEQLMLCLETVKAYFVDLSDIWKEAGKNISKAESLKTLHIQISEIESIEPVDLFTPQFKGQKENLLKLIVEELGHE
jgi:hypothetical protein